MKKTILIMILAILLTACGAGEKVAEKVAETVIDGVVEQAVGEDVGISVGGIKDAIATQEVVFDKNEDGTTTQDEYREAMEAAGGNPMNPLDIALGEEVVDEARLGTMGRHYRASVTAGSITTVSLANNGDADLIIAAQGLPNGVKLPERIAGGEMINETFIVGKDSDLVISALSILSNNQFALTITAEMQNDANSGADAGQEEEPLDIEDGSYTGLFGGADREDAYRVRIPAGHHVEVTLTNGEGNKDPIEYTMRTTDGSYNQSSAILPGSGEAMVMAEVAEYFATVIVFGEQSGGTYTLDVATVGEDDAGTGADISNLAAQAHPIALGETVSGASLDGDEDCYQVELSEGMALMADITSPADQPYESDVSVELRDASNGFVDREAADYGGTATLEYGVASYQTPKAGTYSLCVSGSGYYSTYTEYELTAREVPSDG